MKKTKFNVLFIDKEVASKNFACYFLDNCKLFLLSNKKEKQDIFTSFSFDSKTKTQFDVIFIFSQLQYKQLESLNNAIKLDTLIITNNIASYSILVNNNFNAIYANLNLNNINNQEKMCLELDKTVDLTTFSSKIETKEKTNLINYTLADIVFSNAIQSQLYLANNNAIKLLYNKKLQNHIINLIKEQVAITNSVLLTIDCSKFNFYSFLSSNNILKHLKLILTISNIKKQQIDLVTLKNNIEQILQLNYNNYVEIKYLNKIFEMLT